MAAVALFDGDGRWQDTLVCEQRIRDALQDLGASAGCDLPAGRPPAGMHVLQPAGEAGVFYLPRAGGWLGVLCEAGEGVTVPDALGAFAADAQAPAAGGLLPSQDDFIAHLLSLLGEDAENDTD